MDERIAQFRVGVMVLATLLIAAILVAVFGEFRSPFKKSYTTEIWFDQAQAVTKDTPVRKSGILVGRVQRIRFAEDIVPGGRGVIVTAKLDRSMHDDETCRVVTSLMGDAELQVFRPDRRPGMERLGDQEYVKGEVSVDPTGLKSALEDPINTVTRTGEALEEASSELKRAAENVSELLETNEMGINLAVLQANLALASVSNLAESVNSLIGDRAAQEDLKAAIRGLPDRLEQMKDTMQKAELRLDEMEQFTKKLGSPEMIQRLDQGTKDLSTVMADLAAFSQNLKDPQGSLGLLLKDRQLYDNLNRAAKNVDNLSRQLKPIVKDVRVFTDKIARHPERLGARGVIQRYSGIK